MPTQNFWGLFSTSQQIQFWFHCRPPTVCFLSKVKLLTGKDTDRVKWRTSNLQGQGKFWGERNKAAHVKVDPISEKKKVAYKSIEMLLKL